MKIRLVRNGNSTLKGEVSMKIIPDKCNSFREFLKEATTVLKTAHVQINKGGIKSIYSVYGKKIFLIGDLEDNTTYVAACANELFENMPHLLSYRPETVSSQKSFSCSDSSIASLESNKSDTHAGGCTFRPRHITIVRQGKQPRQIYSLLLNHQTAVSLEKVLSEISRLVSLDSGPLHAVFTQSGRPVSRLEDFFKYHFIFFAFRKEVKYYIDCFVLDEREIEMVNDHNRKTSKKVQISPPLDIPIICDQHKREVLPQIRVKYNLGRNIFKGRFLHIKECSAKATKRDTRIYAMKIISKTLVKYNTILNEISILKGLRHPRIIRLLDIQDSPSQVYIVLELATDGDLNTALMHCKIAEHEAKTFTENLSSALFHLHSLYIVHRNVKPSNLLLSRDAFGGRVLKLAGFGLSRLTGKPLHEECGRTVYMSPEMLRGSGYGAKADVWAAGVVLYYMLVQVPPFLGETDEEDRSLILEGKVDFSWTVWDDISCSAKDLISHMLHSDQRCRFSAEDVLEHPWITGRGVHKDEVHCLSETGSRGEAEWHPAEGGDKFETDNASKYCVCDDRPGDEVRVEARDTDADTSLCVPSVADGGVYKSDEWETDDEEVASDAGIEQEGRLDGTRKADNGTIAVYFECIQKGVCRNGECEAVRPRRACWPSLVETAQGDHRFYDSETGTVLFGHRTENSRIKKDNYKIVDQGKAVEAGYAKWEIDNDTISSYHVGCYEDEKGGRKMNYRDEEIAGDYCCGLENAVCYPGSGAVKGVDSSEWKGVDDDGVDSSDWKDVDDDLEDMTVSARGDDAGGDCRTVGWTRLIQPHYGFGDEISPPHEDDDDVWEDARENQVYED